MITFPELRSTVTTRPKFFNSCRTDKSTRPQTGIKVPQSTEHSKYPVLICFAARFVNDVDFIYMLVQLECEVLSAAS